MKPFLCQYQICSNDIWQYNSSRKLQQEVYNLAKAINSIRSGIMVDLPSLVRQLRICACDYMLTSRCGVTNLSNAIIDVVFITDGNLPIVMLII